MSSFLVEHKTIDRILSYINKCQYSSSRHKLDTSRLAEDFYGDEDYGMALTALGRRLLRMNLDALRTRYEGRAAGAESDKYANDYNYTQVPVTSAQAFFSASCLCYQCAEGEVYKSRFWNELDSLVNEIARHIAYDAADKEKCEWG